MLSDRINKIQPSPTLAINAKAIEMRRQGVDILSFGAGEPDCDTPAFIKEAAKRAIDEGFTKYTATGGIRELKEAIKSKFKRENEIECGVENILVCNGGKQALFNIFMAVLSEGDEVLVPSPYWVSYADMVNVCGGKVKTIDTTSNRFKLTADMVKASITPRTKILILNSPSNPTGMVLDQAEVEKIADLAFEHKFYVISDEVYEHFLYDGHRNFSIGSIFEMRNQVFTVNAVSKTYSMTGWRIGYVCGPREVISAMDALQSHSTSNPCSISQKAALAALTGPQESVAEMLGNFKRRRDIVCEGMNKIPGFKLAKPEGAFYAFPDVSGCFGKGREDSIQFVEFLLREAKVAVVPGIAFGREGGNYIRFTYAVSDEKIQEGLKRIKKSLA
jgi:aspartate aminotransferase